MVKMTMFLSRIFYHNEKSAKGRGGVREGGEPGSRLHPWVFVPEGGGECFFLYQQLLFRRNHRAHFLAAEPISHKNVAHDSQAPRVRAPF